MSGQSVHLKLEGNDVTAENLEVVRVARQKSKWSTDWLTEAAEWEEDGWCQAMELYGSLSFQLSGFEQDFPLPILRTGHEVDPSAWRQLRERFPSAKWHKQLSR